MGKLPQGIERTGKGLLEFNKNIVEATAEHSVAYKINTAFYEQYGVEGWRWMEETLSYLPSNTLKIADAKRGDIGNTSTMYARAFFDAMNFDAITVSPYMGEDSLRPFLEFENKFVICLALTSNAGHSDFQTLKVESEELKLYERVINTVSKWGNPDQLMFVVGATRAELVGEIRKLIPDHFLLVPGVGAQGTHDEPPQEKLLDFAKFCKLMGYPIQIENEKVLRKSFNSLLERSAGKPEADLLQQMSIRTMAKAVYTGQKTSHFGLAFAYYTHFTSPIRRYPDLLAHRILFDLLNAKPSTYNSASIEELAKHSSNMEQKASDAERASIKYKLAELMKLHEGEIFEARVTGVTEWGIYATILDYHAEGLIRLTDIRKDQFYFVEDQRKVVGRRTKREYRLGDIISVRVKKAKLLARNIDLTLID